MNNVIKLNGHKITTTGLVALALIITGCQNTPVTKDSNTTSPASTAIAASSPLQIDQKAPEFTGVDSNNTTHKLSDFKGKVVVLEWTNHQCPFVRKHYNSGNMQKLQKEATSKGVVWLSIISSAPGQQGHVTPQKANELIQSSSANPTAVIIDSEGTIGRLYQARTTPHMYVIDTDGVLKYMGAIDNKPSANPADVETATNYVQAALNSVINNKPVEKTVTQPYGCSVKYNS
ncbi:redoxin domain-containing protein [Moorena sp. SIO4A5]|uniref:redoxin domain-containing protein n=1 Tax=Moorena sp. SIO4A5 TaxID=2607838 RepID=UPI0013CA75F4|nr:redoxin domain-containing protein [Moorena sp. SIO4A5]NEO23136.1 redoxin domain-containing protein [Moorena sp. SIO4A5]